MGNKSKEDSPRFRIFREFKGHGCIDKTGKEVIPCKYDHLGGFYEGLARVNLDHKWGFIDKSGKEVIPCKYDWISGFYEGLARVKLDDKYGYVDKIGRASCRERV